MGCCKDARVMDETLNYRIVPSNKNSVALAAFSATSDSTSPLRKSVSFRDANDDDDVVNAMPTTSTTTCHSHLARNRSLVNRKRKILNDSLAAFDCPMALDMRTVSNVPRLPDSTANTGAEYQYSLNVSMFDLLYNQFFGRTWKGPLVRPQFDGEHVSLAYNQSVYFHTRIRDAGLVLALELIRHQVTSSTDQDELTSSCGWLFIKPFSNIDELTDVTDGKTNTQQSELYYGSPRALLFMEDPLEKHKNLRNIDNCVFTYSLQTHTGLERAMHLIPENILVGGHDVVPGIDEAPKKDGLSIVGDSLRKPKLSRKCPCYIENIVVELSPSVDKFEEEMCKQLNDDRLRRDCKTADGTTVSVVERRLQVGVHNGWCYVDKPQVLHLTTDGASDKHQRGHKRSSSWDGRNVPISGATSLVLKNRVDLNGMVEDPLVAVVLKLEYVIAEPLSALQRQSSMVRAQNVTVCVRWLAWCPFADAAKTEVCLELLGGPCTIPDDVLVYANGKQSQNLPGTIKFKFVSQRKSLKLSMGAPGAADRVDGEEMMERSSAATAAAEAVHLPPLPDSRPPPSARRFEDSRLQFSPSPQPMMGRDSLMPYMTSPYAGIPYPAGSGMMYPQGPMGYPIMVPHGAVAMSQYNESMSSRTVMDKLQEVPLITQTHNPILALAQHGHSGSTLSRAAYARLYSVGFPLILDRHGEPPEVADPAAYVSVDFQKEQYDSLQGNEITLQFLAYSRMSSFISTDLTPADKPSSIFFTFQFYRFPAVTTERLLLGDANRDLSIDQSTVPCILRRLDRTGSLLEKELPGYEVKYNVDPNYLKPGEARLFVHHLSQQTLHVDVWDGETLLLIGTCTVELKHLLRQGQEAVQVTYELDVVATEYLDDTAPNLTGDLTRSGSVRPVGVSTTLKGRLHLRLANCGFPADKGSRKDVTSYHQEIKAIVTPNTSAPQGGSLTSGVTSSRTKNTVRALPLAETNNELASMLWPAEKDTGPDRMDPVKQRKLARMMAVRMANGLENQEPFSLRALKSDKAERTRELKIIDIYREQTKPESIVNMLNRAISIDHTVYPSMGSAEFFEFTLKNPFNVPHVVSIVVKDPELSVVTDVREWRYYKALYSLTSPIDEEMFSKEPKSEFAEIYLRPKEKVGVPFKFLSFAADHRVKPQGPVDPFRPVPRGTEQKTDPASRVAQVRFVTADDKVISILNLQIAPQPNVVNQTFRFHHPEQTFFKKAIRLPPFQHNLPGHPVQGEGVSQVYVRASDSNVICEAKAVLAGEPQDVFVKVACGNSPEVKKFFLAVYNHPFMARPQQIWQFYIHALQRVDVSCTEGQMSKFTLIIRGTQASRCVRCFSSDPLELAVTPSQAFVLAANTVHELSVSVCARRVGNKFLYINVVDTEYHQLVRTWLICLTCKPPVVSKAFELQLPCGGGKGSNKRITYTNPYAQLRRFTLHTNRDDLIQFKETELEIGANQTATIGLRFTPCMVPGQAEVLIFINDADQKTEETFCIKATYS